MVTEKCFGDEEVVTPFYRHCLASQLARKGIARALRRLYGRCPQRPAQHNSNHIPAIHQESQRSEITPQYGQPHTSMIFDAPPNGSNRSKLSTVYHPHYFPLVQVFYFVTCRTEGPKSLIVINFFTLTSYNLSLSHPRTLHKYPRL